MKWSNNQKEKVKKFPIKVKNGSPKSPNLIKNINNLKLKLLYKLNNTKHSNSNSKIIKK